jgi:hypothetical protein
MEPLQRQLSTSALSATNVSGRRMMLYAIDVGVAAVLATQVNAVRAGIAR